jgi:hypothetical protein
MNYSNLQELELVCTTFHTLESSNHGTDKILKESALNVALDLAGLIPGVGEFADGINVVLHARKGEYLAAAFSLISMIPAIGDAIGKGGKISLYLAKLGKAGKFAEKVAKSKEFVKAAETIESSKNIIIKNKNLIEKLFEKAENNEKLKKYVPEMKKSLEAFIGSKPISESKNLILERWVVLAGIES